MATNREILEVGYWSDSSSSSVRSEFDDAYYKMKPPPPQVYNDKIVVIQEGKFPQYETELPNTAKIPSHVQQQKQISNYTNMAESSSKGRTNINYPKAIKTVNTRQNFDRDYNTAHPHRKITNESNMQRMSNANGTSSFYNGTKTNVNTAEQYQNVTVNENFKRGTSSAGALSKNNANNREPHQYSTSRSSITKNNSNENYNLSSEPHRSPTSWNRMDEILSKRINQHSTHTISTNSQIISEDKQSEIIKQLPPPRTRMGRNQSDSASVTTHSTSINSISPIGRHNLPSRKVETASGNLNSRFVNRSNTYNTFSAVQPTARSNNGVQTRQPTFSNSTERSATATTENAEDTCCQILCFCFTCR